MARSETIAEAPSRPSPRDPGFARLSDRFELEARRCTTERDLGDLVASVALELGFDHYALVHHPALQGAASGFIFLHNYPDGWERQLRELVKDVPDPVHAASARSNVGFAWSELGGLVSISSGQRRLLEASERFGIGEGFTVPANVPGEPCGSCSFALRAGRGLPAGRLGCAELIGVHAFAAARRLRDLPRRRRAPRLSRRERQCLRLIARGKTDSEIAIVLGLSGETARQYGKRARAAYDVVSRTQLVVHALADSSLTFDELLGARAPKGSA